MHNAQKHVNKLQIKKKVKDMTQINHKSPTRTENSKKQCDSTKTPPKPSITQRFGTDLGRSVGVTTVT